MKHGTVVITAPHDGGALHVLKVERQPDYLESKLRPILRSRRATLLEFDVVPSHA